MSAGFESSASPSPAWAGRPVDLAPFAKTLWWEGHGPYDVIEHDLPAEELDDGTVIRRPRGTDAPPHIGMQWDTPMRFEKIVVRYREAVPRQAPYIEYWHDSWPAGDSGGWTAVDDPYRGKWIRPECNVESDGACLEFTFPALTAAEIGRDSIEHRPTHRTALKLRVCHPGGRDVAIQSIEVLSPEVWYVGTFRVGFGCVEEGMTWDGHAEAYVGHILRVEPYAFFEGDAMTGPASWAAWSRDVPKALDLTCLYTAAGPEWERTTITLRLPHTNYGGLSFHPADCAPGEPMRMPDLHVTVAAEGEVPHDRPLPPPTRTIYERVCEEPEQSYERASSEIPQLRKSAHTPQRYLPLGFDATREEICLSYTGALILARGCFKVPGPDSEALLWPGDSLTVHLATGGRAPNFRTGEDDARQEPLDGYLPIYTTRWSEDGIAWEQTAFATLTQGTPESADGLRGDEPVVALVRITATNTGSAEDVARLWWVAEPYEALSSTGGAIVSDGAIAADAKIDGGWENRAYGRDVLRAAFRRDGFGGPTPTSCATPGRQPPPGPNALLWEARLAPGASASIDLIVPFESMDTDDGGDLARLDLDAEAADVAAYWRKQIDRGAHFDIPEPLLADFCRANLCHIGITADRDVSSGLDMLSAATMGYTVYLTEAADQIRSLHLRGYHARARRYIEAGVACQGTRRMEGRMSSAEGCFLGLVVPSGADYQAACYSMDHGALLWMIGEQYLLTRDAEWFGSVADAAVAACDFVTRERSATQRLDEAGRKVWEYGLLPPCRLDDNEEWLYWYAPNAYAYRGMRDVAVALGETGHPDAERIAADAAAYGDDIRRALAESRILSPVVKLRDGTWSPHTPVRCRLRGRDVGWIREALYGGILYIDFDLIDADSQWAGWILKDYEDNIYVRPEWGRSMDVDAQWFSWGGITIQPNLLAGPIVYARRDQPEHALRAFYNSFAASLYADVRVFAEHPVHRYGEGVGPFYKTPDESGLINWLRFLLIMEQGEELHLLRACPRVWLADGKRVAASQAPTYFGPVTFEVTSQTSRGRITAEITPPLRTAPSSIVLHVRHPETTPPRSVTVTRGRASVSVNGEAIRVRDWDGPLSIEIAY